ncbi:hypothetical protein TNCV_2204091 [Trichonephila clavipes]|nr:hypothetical protein TNCV_2204091 [Trichonephila clavipes]
MLLVSCGNLRMERQLKCYPRTSLRIHEPKSPPVGVVWKLEEGFPTQVSSSSLDHDSKLRGPSPKALKELNKVQVGITFQDGDRFNSCQVIYSQFGLAIHENDRQARRRFVEWVQNEIAVVSYFHKRILFCD